MQFHPNQLFLLYDPHSNLGKQTKAIATSLNRHILEVDTLHEKLGPTYWKEVVDLLCVSPKDLLDKSHPEYQAKVAGKSFTMNGWLDILMLNAHLIKFPIAIYNGKATVCHNPTDILKLETMKKAPPHQKTI